MFNLKSPKTPKVRSITDKGNGTPTNRINTTGNKGAISPKSQFNKGNVSK